MMYTIMTMFTSSHTLKEHMLQTVHCHVILSVDWHFQ